MRRPPRSNRWRGQGDIHDKSGGAGLGTGPRAVSVEWDPDQLTLNVTFDQDTVNDFGNFDGGVLMTTPEGVPMASQGAAAGISNVVRLAMVYDEGPTHPPAGACSGLNIGAFLHGLDGTPAQGFGNSAFTVAASALGPRLVAAFFEEPPTRRLTLLFNRPIDFTGGTEGVFVWSELDGITLKNNGDPTGGGAGNATLMFEIWDPSVTIVCNPGTTSSSNTGGGVKGHGDNIAALQWTNVNDHHAGPFPAMSPKLLSTDWNAGTRRLELTFDRDLAVVGPIENRVTLSDDTGHGWKSKGVFDLTDEVLTLDMVWGDVIGTPGTCSSNALGTAIVGQVGGAPATDFSQHALDNEHGASTPFIVHATFNVTTGADTLTMYFSDKVSIAAGVYNNKAGLKLPLPTPTEYKATATNPGTAVQVDDETITFNMEAGASGLAVSNGELTTANMAGITSIDSGDPYVAQADLEVAFE